MTQTLRRFVIIFFAVLSILLPTLTPAQAVGPYFLNQVFTGAGNCSLTSIINLPFMRSYHFPTGTTIEIFKVNGVPSSPPEYTPITEAENTYSGFYSDGVAGASSLPYTRTIELSVLDSNGILVIHQLLTVYCSVGNIATATVIDLLHNNNDVAPLFTDGRINPDAGATVVGYCDDNSGIEAYLPNGKQIFKVTTEQIKSALKQAADSHKNVLIKQASGQQLWALASGELQLQDALGSGYKAIFARTICGE